MPIELAETPTLKTWDLDGVTHMRIHFGLPKYTARMMTVSTAHIPRATDIAMHDDVGEGLEQGPLNRRLTYGTSDHGWVLPTGVDQENVALADGHVELANLLKAARLANFAYLTVDGDGPVIPPCFGFPTFDW